MSKRIKIFAKLPVKGSRYALIPVGLYFNKDIRLAKPGDRITFCEGWRQTEAVLSGKCSLKVNTPVFVFLLRSLYRGWSMAGAFFSHWEAISVNEGYGKDSFSRDEVMIVEFKEMDDGKEEQQV